MSVAALAAVVLARAGLALPLALPSAAAAATAVSGAGVCCAAAAEAERAGSLAELTLAFVSMPAGVGGSGVSPDQATMVQNSCCT